MSAEFDDPREKEADILRYLRSETDRALAASRRGTTLTGSRTFEYNGCDITISIFGKQIVRYEGGD
jgi:hypothetical protein